MSGPLPCKFCHGLGDRGGSFCDRCGACLFLDSPDEVSERRAKAGAESRARAIRAVVAAQWAVAVRLIGGIAYRAQRMIEAGGDSQRMIDLAAQAESAVITEVHGIAALPCAVDIVDGGGT